MTIETYVTVHDQGLIEACEASGQFGGLSRTYLFVGPRPVDEVDPAVKLIVARDVPGNVEQWVHFYDFTGWMALTAGRLVEAPQMLCVQYDMAIPRPEVVDAVSGLLDASPGPVAFAAGHRSAHNWMLLIPGFEDEFRAGMAHVGVNVDAFPAFEEWPSTQGTAWRTEEMYEFMGWFRPLFDIWAPSIWAGHLAERSVWAWMMSTGRGAKFLPGAVAHQSLDCHGTCSLMAGQTDVHAARAATFGRPA